MKNITQGNDQANLSLVLDFHEDADMAELPITLGRGLFRFVDEGLTSVKVLKESVALSATDKEIVAATLSILYHDDLLQL